MRLHALRFPLLYLLLNNGKARIICTLVLQGVTLHALIDSCHSGTVMNLPFNAVLRHGQFEDWHEEYKGRSRSWQKVSMPALVRGAPG